MSKFCAKCGTSCPDNATFCHGCGSPMPAQPAPQPQYQQPQYQQPQYQAPQQPRYQAPQQPQSGYQPTPQAQPYHAPQQPQYQAPQQPRYQAPQQPQSGYQPTPQAQPYQAPRQPQYQPQSYGYPPVRTVAAASNATMIRNFIIVIVAIFALVVGFINIFAEYDVSASINTVCKELNIDQPQDFTYKLSEMRDNVNEDAPSSVPQDFVDSIRIYANSTYVIGSGCIAGGCILLIAAVMSFMQKSSAKKVFYAGAAILVLLSVAGLVMAFIGSSSSISETQYGYTVTVTLKLTVDWSYWAAAIVSVCGAGYGIYAFKQEG